MLKYMHLLSQSSIACDKFARASRGVKVIRELMDESGLHVLMVTARLPRGTNATARAAFRAREHDRALQLFTEAIVVCAPDPAPSELYSNRSAVLCTLGRFEEALTDADKVVELTPDSSVQRDHLLVKVRADAATRGQVVQAADLFRAHVVDVAPESLTFEATGTRDKLEAFLEMMEPYGVRELVRSGTLALARGPRSMTDRALAR